VFKKSKELRAEKKIKIPRGCGKCDSCKEKYTKGIDKNLKICPNALSFQDKPRERINLLVDEGSLLKWTLVDRPSPYFKDKSLHGQLEEKEKRAAEEAAIR